MEQQKRDHSVDVLWGCLSFEELMCYLEGLQMNDQSRKEVAFSVQKGLFES